jgi:hypothetical protein
MSEIEIAISYEEADEYGCPHCGYHSHYASVSIGCTRILTCGGCDRKFLVLENGVKESGIGFRYAHNEAIFPALQPHPRKGMSVQDEALAWIKENVNGETKIAEALRMIQRYGGIGGDHHKAWVLDQVVRILAGNRYEQLVAHSKDGEDGPNTYSWDTGIAP